MKSAEVLARILTERNLTVSAAESCTGGTLCGAITEVPGASAFFLGGAIVYGNESKTEVLGVSPDTLKAFGAVSAAAAAEMAEGALALFKSDLAAAVTGIAGPGGGTPAKPVGLVYTAVACRNGTEVSENHFSGDRDGIRKQAAGKAIGMLIGAAEGL